MSDSIVLKNLNKSYSGKKAVEDLSLTVKEGEFLGFLGPNGAGKTTTIRMLTGVLRPDSGSITVYNKDINQKHDISKVIGVLSENSGFYEWMTGWEYLMFFAGFYDVENAKKTVDDRLAELGLAEQKNKIIGAYSRGMKQRLGIARAIINNPKILFLDEPTLGLDPQGQEDVMKLLKDLNKLGVTVFYSSHLLHEVSGLCTRIIIINKGSLVASGTLKELQKNSGNKDLKEIFLSMTGAAHV